MKRLVAALAITALILPLQGAIAGPGSTSGTDMAFYNPAGSTWSLPGSGSFFYGAPGDTPLMCDWNGDGIATAGVYRESTGYLLLSDGNRTGAASYEFYYGVPGDRPVCGDWDGDGIDTIAIYRPSTKRFFLRNSNSQGFGERDFAFGFSAGQPFAGDFNGDGIDTVGLRDPSSGWVEVAPGNFSGSPVMEAYFGRSSDTLVVGDWDGDGTDRLAVYQPATNTLAVTNRFGATRIADVYDLGSRNGIPLAAEFNGSGGVQTTFAEYTGSPLRQVVSYQPEEPPTERFQGPPPVPTSSDWYGSGITGQGLRPRTAGSRDWAVGPIEAPRSGNVDQLALYFVFASEGNYKKGTGGVNRFTIRPDNNGQPGSQVLGEFTISNPTTSGGIWSDWASARGAFTHFRFDRPVSMSAGAKYWIMGENLHSDPNNNWVGINGLTAGDGAPGTAFVHIETAPGSGTFERFVYPGEGWHAGLFDLKYGDGTGFGQGWYHSWFDQNVGGNKKARQVFTPTQNRPVSGLHVWADRSGGSGGLTATLRTSAGVVSTATANGSGRLSFPMNATLKSGTTYYLEFSAPSGTTYAFTSLRENTGWSAGSRFPDGFADYNSGSGWAGGWPIWGSNRQDGDLHFYFSS